jgi:hypothetical protein
MPEMSAEELSNASRMRQMIFGQLLSRSLCVVARLNLPDMLAAGPQPVGELAARTGADPLSLRRLMRGLAMFDVFTEPADGVFALTPLGRMLCTDTPGTARPSALLVGGVVGSTWSALEQTIRTGKPAFNDLFGANFFDHLEDNPEVAATFSWSQAEGLALEMPELISEVDFSHYPVIVDIGGGDGAFLAEVLTANPDSRGVLFELPGVTPLARKRMAANRLDDRCTIVSGDFFESVPADGDMYLLSHVLHDWNDRDARTVLLTCATAMPAHATLTVIDLVTAERGDTDPTYRYPGLLDLYMLSLFGGNGGRERTASEFCDLIESAGFREVRARRLASGMACIQATLG